MSQWPTSNTWSVTTLFVFDNSFQSMLGTFPTFWLLYEVEETLVCFSHCYNRFLPPNSKGISSSYNFHLNTWSSGPIHLIYFNLCFMCGNIQITSRNVDTFWGGQVEFPESCEIIITSVLVFTRPSIRIPFTCNFNFDPKTHFII